MKIEILFHDESKLTLDGYIMGKEDTDWIYFHHKGDSVEYQLAKSEIRAIVKTG